MTDIASEADIRCPAGKIFNVIIDSRGQDRLLMRSPAFRDTTAVSSDAVTLGTSYREPGPSGCATER